MEAAEEEEEKEEEVEVEVEVEAEATAAKHASAGGVRRLFRSFGPASRLWKPRKNRRRKRKK